MAEARQVARRRQRRRPATDQRNSFARTRRDERRPRTPRVQFVIRDETFEPAYADRLAFDGQHALLLALVFLLADAPADGRQAVLLADDGGGACVVALKYRVDELRD